jgi:hypothetical protein
MHQPHEYRELSAKHGLTQEQLAALPASCQQAQPFKLNEIS